MKNETKLFLGIIIGTIAIVIAGILILSRSAAPVSVNTSLLVRADSNKIATGSGTITMVEFGDFQCPACGVYYPVVKQVISDFHNQMTYVFRNFPLDTVHANAHIAAQAAEAAGKQNKYWEMHDMLYEKQSDWADKNNAKDIFSGYAQTLGLSVDQFKKDIDSSEVTAKVQEDVDDANALGISQTPTFFIDGQKIDNPASLADFEALVRGAIDKAPKPTVTKTEAYHIHANFKVSLNGTPIDFSQAKYQGANGKDLDEFIHLHNNKGDLIHIHKQGVTLGEFFTSLKMKLSNGSFADDAGNTYTVKMFVNGKENSQFASYVPQDLDKILITNATDAATEQGQIMGVPDDACIYSLKCPARGTPPTENCVGGLGTGCTE